MAFSAKVGREAKEDYGNPDIGPGYVDHIPFTEKALLKRKMLLGCNSKHEIDAKVRGLRIKAKLDREKAGEIKQAMEAQKLEGQATFERRKRTDWANSQRQLRRERLDRESEAKRTRMRRLVEYDAKNDRMPSLRKQAKAYDRVQSPAFQANAKAVAKTDDNFVRVLASRERGPLT